MRGWCVCALVLAWPLSSAAQTPEVQAEVEKKLTLEKLLQGALQNNPDIRLAEAQVREAEAKLNRVRLEVLQKVALVKARIRVAEAGFEEAKSRHATAELLFKKGVISTEELQAARLTVQKYQAELEVARAELPMLLGETPAGMKVKVTIKLDDPATAFRRAFLELLGRPISEDELRNLGKASAPGVKSLKIALEVLPQEKVDKLRAFLEIPVQGKFSIPPFEVLEVVLAKHKGMNVQVAATFPPGVVSLDFKEPIPLGALFQWFEDRYPVRLVLRDYGLVLVDEDRLPPGGVLALPLWKAPEKSGMVP